MDPELAAALDGMPLPPHYERRQIDAIRTGINAMFTAESLIARAPPGIGVENFTTQGPHGDITLSVLRRQGSDAKLEAKPRSCLYWIHGGGMIFGNRFMGASRIAEWVAEFDLIAVLVEYRLAPECPAPAPVEDSYAGLCWAAANAATLGLDLRRIIVVGQPAGGGLAAGVSLMARDRPDGPQVQAQMLLAPMLDDRSGETQSTKQHDGKPWSRASNAMAWECILNGRDGESIGMYSVPGRATSHTNLPHSYVDVGSAEIFRDTVIAFASRLLEAGVATELHVWQGGFHGFDDMIPQAALSRAAKAAQKSWLERTLAKMSNGAWGPSGSAGSKFKLIFGNTSKP